MAHIRWSNHADDAKIGQVEDVDDNLAARLVDTGMAQFAEPEPEPTVAEAVLIPSTPDTGDQDPSGQDSTDDDAGTGSSDTEGGESSGQSAEPGDDSTLDATPSDPDGTADSTAAPTRAQKRAAAVAAKQQ